MRTLGIEDRAALCAALVERVAECPRMPDGSLAMIETACDSRVLRALALDFYNGRTGRCDPGFRAIAAKARVALGTVTNATRRLRRAGWISWKPVLRYVHGTLRFCRAYTLAEKPPELRSRAAPNPTAVIGAVDKPPQQRSMARQLALAAQWATPEATEMARRAYLARAQQAPVGVPGRGRGAPLR